MTNTRSGVAAIILAFVCVLSMLAAPEHHWYVFGLFAWDRLIMLGTGIASAVCAFVHMSDH